MVQPVMVQGMGQRPHHMVLTYQSGKGAGSKFARENLVTHDRRLL